MIESSDMFYVIRFVVYLLMDGIEKPIETTILGKGQTDGIAVRQN